jgi:hypothetical protein
MEKLTVKLKKIIIFNIKYFNFIFKIFKMIFKFLRNCYFQFIFIRRKKFFQLIDYKNLLSG